MYLFDINSVPTTAKMVSGVDTTYYNYETTPDYVNLFLDIVDQIEDAKSLYLKRDIPYKNSEITVEINTFKFTFGGYKEGFYWLNSIDSYFTMGFKDSNKMRHMNDIQVQINAIGIYTYGLTAMLKLADSVVEGFVTGYKPITRMDFNTFVQINFSWLTSDMFIARQLKRERLRDKTNGTKSWTIYIGDNPFLLRIYDKLAEMKQSKKKEIMEEYFLNNGLELDKPITNIEFEMHRKHLKRFNIKTVDDALANAEALFKQAMDDIRLVNLESITKNELISNNRCRAKTLPIWEYIRDNYSAKEFLQLDLPLERIKRKVYTYDADDAIRDFIAFEHRCNIHGITVDEWFMEAVGRQKTYEEKERIRRAG